ncbi:MAG: hypothetical protein ACI9EF_003950 [Pseudohongiellaceae bacterium]|jgi:hypothetical protein
MARRTPGLVALAGALLVLVAVGSSSPWAALATDARAQSTSDFQILHSAGQGLAEGLDVHDPLVLDRVGQRVGRPLTPFCAALPLVVGLFGLAGRDFGSAYESWLLANIALGCCAAFALAACLRRGMSAWLALALALLAVGLPPSFWHSLAMNSTNLVALAALSLAWWSGERGLLALEGLALSLAILAKTSPALVLVTMLLAGRWSTVLWAAAWFVASVGASVMWLGWEIHVSWFTRVLPVLGYSPVVAPGRFNNAMHAWNLSPNGLLTRAAAGPGWWAAAGAWVVTALVLMQLWGAVKGSHSRAKGVARGDVGGLYALSVAGMFLVSSVTWPHHLVLAAIPGVWLLLQGFADSEKQRGQLVATLCGLVSWSVLALPLGMFGGGDLQPLDIPLKTGACLVLFGALVSLYGMTSEVKVDATEKMQ